MSVFEIYARYYDLLYKDKDYDRETEYVHQLIQRFAPHTSTILEMGCGTGKHAALLTSKGYTVCGVDKSLEMLAQANKIEKSLPAQQASHIEFVQGDIRKIQLNRKFDSVIALFHVVSYQTSNGALYETLANAKKHLSPEGIFIFDVWYGPAVLKNPPVVRVKRLEDTNVEVTRIAEPHIYRNRSTVDVNYQVFIKKKNTKRIEQIKETHKMRYLFLPEIEMYCDKTGFELIHSEEWLTGNEPGECTWGVCFILSNNSSGL
jgi:SAM-dependent methyltransferase